MIKLNKINKETILSRKPDLDCTELDGDIVMMDLDKGEYFMLNPVANSIWENIESPIAVSDLISNLMTEYEVDEKTCYLNVIDFLGKLNDSNLLVINN